MMSSVDKMRRARNRRRRLAERPQVECKWCGYGASGFTPEILALFREQHPDEPHEWRSALTIYTQEQSASLCAVPGYRIEESGAHRPLVKLTQARRAQIIQAAADLLP